MGLSNRKGDIAEARVLYEATVKGYYTASMCQDCPYDMVIDRGKGPIRVQVKYTAKNKRGYAVVKIVDSVRSNKRPYTSDDIDVFVVYIPDTDKTLWIPFKDVDNVKEIWMRVGDPKWDVYEEW